MAKKTIFVRMLANVKTAQRMAMAMRKKAKVAKNCASLRPSNSCPVVEYKPYAPYPGVIVAPNVSQKPPKMENTVAGNVLPIMHQLMGRGATGRPKYPEATLQYHP
jgi:hypothetical protein